MNLTLSTSFTRAAVGAAALLAMAGCAAAIDAAAPSTSAAKTEPRSAALQARVVQLIGDAECSAQEQCRKVGLGAKPCGGAESWLPWSTKVTDAQALQEAVLALAQARVEENKAGGLASDCMRRPDPTVVCRPRASDGKKTCQLGQGGTDSAI